jgi:hypothetical protein
MGRSLRERQAAAWVKDVWLPSMFGQWFSAREVPLQHGGSVKLNCVSDSLEVAAILLITDDKAPTVERRQLKLQKLRAEALMLKLATLQRRLVVVCHPQVFRAINSERELGLLPAEFEIHLARVPENVGTALGSQSLLRLLGWSDIPRGGT